MNKRFKSLIKDTFIFAVGSLGSKLILFLLVPLYTNAMTTEEYGVAELVFTVSQLIIPVISICIWNGMIRYGLKVGEHRENAFLIGILIWIIGSILLFISTPLLGIYKAISDWKWYLSIYSSVFILNQINLNYLKVIDKNRLFALISLIQTASLAFLNIWLLVFENLGVKGYLLSNIFAHLVAITLTLIIGDLFQDIKTAKLDKTLARKMILYSLPLIINDLSWWVVNSSDKVMVQIMVSASALGLYTVAAKIPSLINTFVNIFSQAWGLSSIKEIESTNDTAYYSKVLDIYSFIAFGLSMIAICIIKPFMRIYVGIEFLESWKYVPLLLAAASFSAISAYFGSMYGALEKSFECMFTSIIGGIANIICNYFFIIKFKIWGAILGTVIAYLLITVIRLFGILRYIPIDIKWKKLMVNSILITVLSISISFDIYMIIVTIIVSIIFIFFNQDNFLLFKEKLVRN